MGRIVFDCKIWLFLSVGFLFVEEDIIICVRNKSFLLKESNFGYGIC